MIYIYLFVSCQILLSQDWMGFKRVEVIYEYMGLDLDLQKPSRDPQITNHNKK